MYLADENVPLQAIQALRAAGIDIAAISELMAGASDTDVMLRARLESRILLTFDKDFAELAFREQRQASPGIILLRLRPRSPAYVADVLVRLLTGGYHWQGQFSVVTDSRVRMIPICSSPHT